MKHPLTLRQECIKYNYKIDPILSKILWIREQSQNAFSHKANTAYIKTISLPVDGKMSNFAMLLHDGEAFEDKYDIENSLYPNTSNDDYGSQGNGGKLSGLLLVNQNSRYLHMVYSNTIKDGPQIRGASIRDDASIEVRNFNDIIKHFKHDIDDKYTVGYLTRFDDSTSKNSKHHDIQNIEVMASVPHICPTWLNQNKDIKFYDVLGDKDAHTISPNKFDDNFMSGKFVLPVPPTVCKFDSDSITLTGEIIVTLYYGMYTKYPRGYTVLTHVQGNQKGEGSRLYAQPYHNTFLYLDAFKNDKRAGRLAVDPCYVGCNLDTVTGILQTTFADVGETFQDVSEFPEFTEMTKECRSKSKTTLDFTRKPFAKVVINVKTVEPNNSYIRQILPIDEFFMAGKIESMKIIKNMLDGAVNNIENKDILKSMREESRRLWPRDVTKYAAIQETRLTKYNMLHFSYLDGEPISEASPGERAIVGKLSYPDGHPFDEKLTLNSDIPGNYMKCAGDDTWTLTVSPLKEKLPNGDSIKIDESRFRELDPKKTYPKRDIEFVDKFGTSYLINTRVKIPERNANTRLGPKGPQPIKDGDGKKKVATRDYLKPAKPPERLLTFASGKLTLNSNNADIDILFRDVQEKESWRNRFFPELRDICKLHWKNTISTININGWGLDNAVKLQEDWGNEYDQYLLNKIIEPLFDSDRIKNVKNEILEILARNNEPGIKVAETIIEELPDDNLEAM